MEITRQTTPKPSNTKMFLKDFIKHEKFRENTDSEYNEDGCDSDENNGAIAEDLSTTLNYESKINVDY